jgi:membrane protease subunit HflK
VREPSATLRYVSESVMREVVGDRTVDEVITIGRQEIESRGAGEDAGAGDQIRHGHQHRSGTAEEHQPAPAGAGLVQRGQPGTAGEGADHQRGPPRIQPVIPLAEGEKDQRIREADGYRLRRINEAEGDAARFTALMTEYRLAPEVTRRRIYIETLQDVLPGIGSKIIVDGSTAASCRF